MKSSDKVFLKISDNSTLRQRVRKKPNEDYKMLDVLERELLRKRGYVFRMPKAGTPVVMLVSGGLDSIVLWAILLKEFKLKVYPVFFMRGTRFDEAREMAALDYFSSIYKHKYGSNYQPPHKLIVAMPEFSDPYRDLIGFLHSSVMVENMLQDGSLKPSFSLGHFAIFPPLAFMYAKFLHARENIEAKTIFCGTTFSDNASYRSLASARSVMTTFILMSGEHDWQYTSVAYEPTIPLYLTKSALIQWAEREGLSLARAWSCTSHHRYQCGICLACQSRQSAYTEARVIDPTYYGHNRKSLIRLIGKKIVNKASCIFDAMIHRVRTRESLRKTRNAWKSTKYEPPMKSKIYLKV